METKKIRNGGFTLLETLLTVAILIILMALSAVGVARYKDYLDVTELDNAARDIYMAAENRAVLLQNSGASVKLLSTGGGGGDPVVLTSTQLKEDSNRDLLPAGTIDPALWKGDFRIVYDQTTGHVKEVFYAEKGDIGTDLDPFRTDDRSARVNLFRGGKTLVGYYNGGIAGEIGTKPLPTPGVEVFIDNGEELTLKATYTLPEGLPAGVTYTPSVKLYYPTNSTTPIELFAPTSTLSFDKGTATFEKVLDSLAKDAWGNSQQFKDLGSGLTGLGKNFTVSAGLTLKADGWIESAYYAEGTDNSLFAKQTGDGDTAYIANLRHLQNLGCDEAAYGNGNSYGYKSGVGLQIESAKQTTDIECKQYKGVKYSFLPIVNKSLTSYDGQEFELRHLYAPDNGGGMFLGVAGNPGMTVQNIRMIEPYVSNTTGGSNRNNAGCLISRIHGGNNVLKNVWVVNGTAISTNGGEPGAGGLIGWIGDGTVTIDGCRVYWDKPEQLVKDGKIDYKVQGKYAGGLVGHSGGTLTIQNSYAATTVRKHSDDSTNDSIGGLVGHGNVAEISNSYADCYLGIENGVTNGIGGLVGNGSVTTLTNSYAAGFIMGRDNTATAGLVGGNVTTATNCYSVVRVIKKGADGKETLEKPATPLYGTIGEPASGSVRYLSKAKDVTENQFGNAFEYIDADNSPETHVYDLRYEMSKTPGPADEALKLTPPYPFPGLKGADGTALPHYGDWADLEDGKTLIPAGLAYYETYGSGDTAVHGAFGFHEEVSLDTLKKDLDNPVVTTDGYALVFPKGEEALSGTYKVTYGSSSPYTLTISESSMKWTEWSLDVSAVSLPTTQGTGEDAKEYILIPLPDRVMTDALSGTSPSLSPSFYQKLQVDLLPDSGSTPVPGLTRSFWFNPHFAKTVVKQDTKPSDPAGTEASAIIVRTARHLRNLGMIRYTTYGTSYQTYVYNKSYYFKQELDLDYATYKGYLGTGFLNGITEKNPYVQDCIGTAYKTSSYGSSYTANLQFRGTYDGGYHIIRNVVGSWSDANSESGGLFGMVGSGGVLKNIAYAFNPDHTISMTVGKQYYGALVGFNSGTVENCAVYGLRLNVSHPTYNSYNQVGGLVGRNAGTVQRSSAEVASLTIDQGYAGGLVGYSQESSSPYGYGTIESCYAVGKIYHPQKIYDSNKTAKISGLSYNGSITNCYAAVQLVRGDDYAHVTEMYGLCSSYGFLLRTSRRGVQLRRSDRSAPF